MVDGLAILIGLVILGMLIQGGLTNIAKGLKAIAMSKNPELFTQKEIEAMKEDIKTNDD